MFDARSLREVSDLPKKKITRVAFRRRREGKTDYRKRLALIKSGKTRAVVRKTNSKTIVQIIEYHSIGDKVLATAISPDIVPHGWSHPLGNTPASYLTGLLAGRRAIKKGITEAVLDIGLSVPVRGSKAFAALKGLLDAGMNIPHGKKILPLDETINGTFIQDNIPPDFEKVKESILKKG